MTDAPLDRAARALMKSQSGVDGLESLPNELQEGLLNDVRATLLATRKPSEAMIRAALTVELPGNHQLAELEAVLIWERMVDAAVIE